MRYNKMKFDSTITVWDEAIPLGNGALGCLIWGNSDGLRLSIDRCDIWDCTDPPQMTADYSYKTLVELARKGDVDRIRKIFSSPYSKPAPTKLPAGKIIINMGVDANVVSELDIERAEATITADGVVVESFLDAADTKVGFIKINNTSSVVTIENPAFGIIGEIKPEEQIHNSLKTLHYERAKRVCEEKNGVTYKCFTQKISDVNTYGLFLLEKDVDGTKYVVYTVERGLSADEISSIAWVKLEKALERGYENVREDHLAWWKEYWTKSFIKLDEDEFFERNWYLSNYFLGSCSRKGYFPMPLQGVWTADDGEIPPWKGDYHHDLNTELSYYSYLKANHIEEGESFVDYVISLEEGAKKFAKAFYDVDDGLCVPGCMDIEGNSLGGWVMYSLSPVNCAWLCRGLMDYYDYTANEEFLKDKAYPFMKKYAQFLLQILCKNEDGKLVLPISSSPEIHDDEIEAFLTPNSTYDLSLMTRLFTDLLSTAKLFGYDSDAKIWEETLNAFDPLPTDTDGALLLARDERLLESHRHFSHMMAIHPLKLLRYDTDENKRIIEASIASNEELGYYMYVGYSFPLMSEICAVARNGQKAHEYLKMFWDYFCLPNGFHCNGDYKDKIECFWKYRPFTLEGNMCAADALQEMLLQDLDDSIVICPAIPEDWKNYSFKLRSAKGLLVTVSCNNGEKTITLEALRDVSTAVEWALDKVADVTLKKGEAKTITL